MKRSLIFILFFIFSFSSFSSNNTNLSEKIFSITHDCGVAEVLIKKGQLLKAFNLYLKISVPLKNIAEKGNQNQQIFAYRTYFRLISLTDTIRNKFKDAGTKMILSKHVFPIYENTVELAFQLYSKTKSKQYLDDAFILTEKNKNLLIVEAIRDSKAKNLAGIPDRYLNAQQNIASEMVILRSNLDAEQHNNNRDEKNITKLEKKILGLQQINDSINFYIQRIFPKYYNLYYKDKFATVKQVKEKLISEDKSLLEYFYGDSCLYCFVISSKKDTFVKIDQTDSLTKLIPAFLSIIRKNSYSDFVTISYELFKILIRPVQSILQNKIIIIPDGPINYIPFECLIRKDADKRSMNYKTLDYLINSFQFCYAPSATTLIENKAHNINTELPKMLAFAPVFTSSQKSVINTIKHKQPDSVYINLAEQRWSYKLIKELKRKIDGHYFTYEKATVSNFKKYSPDCDIIHIASHTLIDNEYPMNSKIVFSKEIVGDSVTNEGYLYAYDLYNLHINASMVVLGSCQTGIGNFKRCDGITSIAHGFSYAGCPSIVYSLWEIDERESSSLMKLFYMQLMTGLPKDEALNNAKRMYLKASNETTANPYYWAGFIFSGDTTPFNFKNKNEYLFYLIPGILLFLIAILYFFLFRRYQSNS